MNRIIGGHLSTSNGFKSLFAEVLKINAKAVQIFLSSNRSWDPQKISKEKKDVFFLHKALNISIVVHATYLINLASFKDDIRKKSEFLLLQQLMGCDELDIPFLVLHPGSFTTDNLKDGIARISESLENIFSKNKIDCKILLENMAGQGSVIGSGFDELKEIREKCAKKESIGFCLDTAHLFGAGYRFATAEELETLLTEFDRKCGLQNLFVVHINDSLEKFGSRKDRHANIGKGEIGLKSLQRIFHHKQLDNKIFILETPWSNDGKNNYQEEISLLSKA